MKLWMALVKLYRLPGYFQRRRKQKLYRQWVERADLPPDAMPKEEFTEDKISDVDKKRIYRRLLFILLGIFLVILCIGIGFLIIHSC